MNDSDYIEGIRMARKQASALTAEELLFLNEQSDFLLMGIRVQLNPTQTAIAERIRAKFNKYRYGDN